MGKKPAAPAPAKRRKRPFAKTSRTLVAVLPEKTATVSLRAAMAAYGKVQQQQPHEPASNAEAEFLRTGNPLYAWLDIQCRAAALMMSPGQPLVLSPPIADYLLRVGAGLLWLAREKGTATKKAAKLSAVLELRNAGASALEDYRVAQTNYAVAAEFDARRARGEPATAIKEDLAARLRDDPNKPMDMRTVELKIAAGRAVLRPLPAPANPKRKKKPTP